jgi:hypothetical protein
LDRIREFEARDIEQVADLHCNVFRLDLRGQLDAYHAYFSQQFLSTGKDSLPSLVCEDQRGQILGFLGVVVRYFSFEGKKITGALSSHFVVHPEGRQRLTGIHMLREFLNGPQDLSFTDEANDLSQRIWVALGGSVSAMQGIHWILPLRPFGLACHRFLPRWVATTLTKPAGIFDRIVSSVMQSPKHNSAHTLTAEPLCIESMLAHFNEFSSHCRLLPHYDRASLSRLIECAQEKRRKGSLRGALLRDQETRIAGWYWYHFERDGLAEVLQIVSPVHLHQRVVSHLVADARASGATAVVGRLEPGLAQPLANQFCLLFRRAHTMLVHSRFPEILYAIHSGRAFISRMDGEWCLRFA